MALLPVKAMSNIPMTDWNLIDEYLFSFWLLTGLFRAVKSYEYLMKLREPWQERIYKRIVMEEGRRLI